MANSPSRGAWRCTRQRKSCSRSSAVGTPNDTTLTPRGLRQPATCLMAPSLPALSRPCSTSTTLLIFAPQSASWSANNSAPSASKRFCACSLEMRLGGSVEISSSRTFSPRFVKTVFATRRRLVLRWQLCAREELLDEAELRQVADAHGIEHAIEVIDLVLHHARVEPLHFALEALAALVAPGVAKPSVARHPAAHAGNREATLPALLPLVR